MTALSSLRQNTVNMIIEEPSQEGTLPFLDTLVTRGLNNTLYINSLQKTYTHRSILTLGQQPLYNSQIQFLQHIGTQGQNCFNQLVSFKQGIESHQEGPPGMPIPSLGTE